MEQQQNEKKKEDRVFDENIIQVTDTISTINIYWDTKKTTEELPENFIHHNNMKILATCIGRMIEDSNEQEIVLFDVAAHGNWESATIDSIYGIGKSKGLLGLYFISLGKVNVLPQQLVPLKTFNIDAKDAAITFDGDWILNDTSNVFSLRTEDAPWIFYITKTGKLYRKHGAVASATLMAENVEMVAAERGYFPEEHLDINSDQGVVVVYLKKNGELVYRSYAYSSATGKKEWLSEEVIDTFVEKTVKNISIHRLNDYRMGVCVSLLENNKYKNLWYITDRCYAEMAFRPERFFVSSASIHNPIYGCINYDENCNRVIQPNWEWTINEAHDIVTLTSDLSLVYFNNFQDVLQANGDNKTAIFTTQDTTSDIYKIESIEDKQIKIYFSERLLKNFTITFNPHPSLDFAAKINCISGGGLVKINSQSSHLFDISEKLKYNYNEKFEVSNAAINNFTVEMHYITTLKLNPVKEKFVLKPAEINSFNAQMHKISTIQNDNSTEYFSFENATINKFTVDDIQIIITIPI